MKELSDIFVRHIEDEGYIPQGLLYFKLPGGKFTAIYYYNDSNKAIPCYGQHKYFMPSGFPYYVVRYRNRFYGGSYEEIEMSLKGRKK